MQTATVTFGEGGGSGVPTPALTGLDPGTTCTVVEATDGFPDGSVVTYSPSQTVTIVEDETVTVTVENDFSGVEIQTGFLQISKVVEPGVALPATLTVRVACDDGTEATVTV